MNDYKLKYDKLQEKLKNIALKGNTKYSLLMAERDNKITTSPGDVAYNYELEAFNIKQIIDISVYVLEKQMKEFQNILYTKYQNDIIKFRKGIVGKNMKSIEIWTEMEKLAQVQ